MTKALDLGRLLGSSGKIPLASGIEGVLPDANAPSGSVIQVWSAFSNSRVEQSGGQNTWYDISGMSLTLTPQFANSRLMVLCNINYSGGEVNSPSSSTYVRMLRDENVLNTLNGSGQTGNGNSNQSLGFSCFAQYRNAGGDDDNYHMDNGSLCAVISTGSTASTTFRLQWRIQGTAVFQLNGDPSFNEENSGDHQPAGISYITVLEIAA